MMSQDLSGWGKLTADLMAEIRQDYGKSDILLFSLRPPEENAGGQDVGGRQELYW